MTILVCLSLYRRRTIILPVLFATDMNFYPTFNKNALEELTITLLYASYPIMLAIYVKSKLLQSKKNQFFLNISYEQWVGVHDREGRALRSRYKVFGLLENCTKPVSIKEDDCRKEGKHRGNISPTSEGALIMKRNYFAQTVCSIFR